MTYYMLLDKENRSWDGGRESWKLPQDGHPGEWVKAPRRPGITLCLAEGITGYDFHSMWEAEPRGEVTKSDWSGVFFAREARLTRPVGSWNERTARLFACDCTERTLPFFEQQYPDDARARTAIETARRFAEDKATLEELNAAQGAVRDAVHNVDTDAHWIAGDAREYGAAQDAAKARSGARRTSTFLLAIVGINLFLIAWSNRETLQGALWFGAFLAVVSVAVFLAVRRRRKPVETSPPAVTQEDVDAVYAARDAASADLSVAMGDPVGVARGTTFSAAFAIERVHGTDAANAERQWQKTRLWEYLRREIQ